MNQLSSVKVGDKVLLTSSHGEGIATVLKVTPTQIHTRNHRFRIKDGHPVGDSTWSTWSIQPCSPEDYQRITLKRKVAAICAFIREKRLEDLPIEKLEHIKTIIEP